MLNIYERGLLESINVLSLTREAALRQVQRTEQELGFRLFERHNIVNTDHYLPTAEGRAWYVLAKRVGEWGRAIEQLAFGLYRVPQSKRPSIKLSHIMNLNRPPRDLSDNLRRKLQSVVYHWLGVLPYQKNKLTYTHEFEYLLSELGSMCTAIQSLNAKSDQWAQTTFSAASPTVS